MKRLFKKKAYTLVELIIAMGVMVILVGAVMALFTPVQNIAGSLSGNADINTTYDTISDYFYNKLYKASTCYVKQYSDEELVSPYDAANDSNLAFVANYFYEKNIAASGGHEKMYGMAIKEIDGITTIFDLGEISIASADPRYYGNKIASVTSNESKYKLFRDEYYRDVNYKITFDGTIGSGGLNTKKWCKIGVTAFDKDGNNLMETRHQMFKLLNFSIENNSHMRTDSTLKDVKTIDSTKTTVVIYCIKDYAA